jgi:hypothetical protein
MATDARAFNPNDPSEVSKLFAGKAVIGANGKLTAAADYLGNGAIEINKYEAEILDVVRRDSPTLARLREQRAYKKATGHPHRYFEQIAIATATATDPRNITTTPSGPVRVERAAMIKATTSQSNFSHFDVEVTAQQGDFSKVEAQDITDIASAITVKNAEMFWLGSDTSLAAPTTIEWVGVIQQLVTGNTSPASGNVVTINKLGGASIIDGVKTAVAKIHANVQFKSKPSIFFCATLLADLIDQEAKAAAYHFNKTTFVAGVQVDGLQTVAGVLPIVSDPFIPSFGFGGYTVAQFEALVPGVAVPVGTNFVHIGAIMSESLIELPYVNPNGDENPRIFQLGLVAGLQGQFVGIFYGSAVVKGAPYGHALVVVFSAT